METIKFFFLIGAFVAAMHATPCNYCDLYGSHTLCNKTGFGSNCGSQYQNASPSQSDQDIILDWHNAVRQNAAAGLQEAQGNSCSLPTASNMELMSWDTELARIAQALADECVFAHDAYEEREVCENRFWCVGQNLALLTYGGPTGPSTIDWPFMMNLWYDYGGAGSEVQQFHCSYVNDFVGGPWGHYSQVIWASSKFVGCGASVFISESNNKKHFVVCNYGPCGNIIDQPVYSGGSTCSGCPSGCDATFTALCV